MDTKTCGRCRQEKPLAEFARCSGRADGLQRWCKACKRAHDANHYQVNKTRRVRQAAERRRARAGRIHEYKTANPCADCGGFFHFAAMQFDHRPGEVKVADISSLVRRHGISGQRLADELAKCDLVCANCHAVRTYVRME